MLLSSSGRCAPPACTVFQGKKDAGHSIFIDLTLLEDCEECRQCWTLQPVHMDIEVAPLDHLSTGSSMCGMSSSGKCVSKGTWHRYDLGCTEKAGKKLAKVKSVCWRPVPRQRGESQDPRNPQLVKVAVASVVIL